MNKRLWEFCLSVVTSLVASALWYIFIEKSILMGIGVAIGTFILIWFVFVVVGKLYRRIFSWFVIVVVRKLYDRYFSCDFPEIHSMYQSQEDSNDDMKELLSTASKLEILTIRGLGIIGLNDSALRQTLHSTGGRRIDITVFMLSKESRYVSERASELNETPERFQQAIDLGIECVKELKNSTIHNIKLYEYDHKPCWRIIRIDDTFFVSVFDEQLEGHRANVYRIDGSQNGTLGRALKRYLECVRDQANEIV